MTEEPTAAVKHRSSSLIFAGLYLFFLVWIILFKLNVPHLGSGELRSIKLLPFLADSRFAASGMKEKPGQPAAVHPPWNEPAFAVASTALGTGGCSRTGTLPLFGSHAVPIGYWKF